MHDPSAPKPLSQKIANAATAAVSAIALATATVGGAQPVEPEIVAVGRSWKERRKSSLCGRTRTISFITARADPGKTDCQLTRFASNVGIGYGSYWRGVIFDRKYKNLDDLIIKSKRIFKFNTFGDRCKFLESKGDL
jgi:hypothetical protein